MLRRETADEFRVSLVSKVVGAGRLASLVEGAIEQVLALDKISRIYARTKECPSEGVLDYLNVVLGEFRVKPRLAKGHLEKIPRQGPLVVVANHPFGGIEGIILPQILQRVRPDVKVMANYLLRRIPELNDLFIFVDPFGTRESGRANLRPMREAIQWLSSGGALCVFPAGEVSSLQLQERAVVDPAWAPAVARIIRKAGATVLPVFFGGANGPLFQLLGLIHPRLRTALLPRELLNKVDREILIRVGQPIPFDQLARFDDDASLMSYLRLKTYLLDRRIGQGRPRLIPRSPRVLIPFRRRDEAAIETPQDTAAMLREISALGPEQKLAQSGDEVVYVAEAGHIPVILKEIGRLREETFRLAGEGTGRSIDLDRFDADYLHLFLWDHGADQMVGAYRLGPVDRVIERQGRRGLYTNTLFKFRPEFFHRVRPALEMGRSFIRAEYQRSYMPLLLLWKGIGAFVQKNPDYRYLFGVVSIDKRYRAVCRHLMMEFLRTNHFDAELAGLVRPRTPVKLKSPAGCTPQSLVRVMEDVEDLSGIIADIGGDGRGVPILLKHYLRLGGRILGFNLDPRFGDVIDGLIVVDVLRTDLKVLGRLMGNKEALAYHAHHGHEPSQG